jgi:hypothetical protein
MPSRVLAAVAALLSLGVLGALAAITRGQGEAPAWWFVAALLVATTGLGYGSTRGAHRGVVLIAASGLLMTLGLLGILSIGLPLLLAGVLAFVASQSRGVTPLGAAGP